MAATEPRTRGHSLGRVCGLGLKIAGCLGAESIGLCYFWGTVVPGG